MRRAPGPGPAGNLLGAPPGVPIDPALGPWPRIRKMFDKAGLALHVFSRELCMKIYVVYIFVYVCNVRVFKAIT